MSYPARAEGLVNIWWDKGVRTFPKGISPKVNLIVQLEFEVAYYKSHSQNSQLDIKQGQFTKEELNVVLTKIKSRKAPSHKEIPWEEWILKKYITKVSGLSTVVDPTH